MASPVDMPFWLWTRFALDSASPLDKPFGLKIFGFSIYSIQSDFKIIFVLNLVHPERNDSRDLERSVSNDPKAQPCLKRSVSNGLKAQPCLTVLARIETASFCACVYFVSSLRSCGAKDIVYSRKQLLKNDIMSANFLQN